MVSRNNIKYKAQQDAKCVPHYGIRKLSIGVASVLLGTVFYMQNGTAHADVNPTVSTGNDSVNVVNKDSGTSGSAVASSTSTGVGSADSAGSIVSTGDATNSMATSQTSGSSSEGATKQASNTALAASEPESTSSVGQVDAVINNSNAISSLPPALHHQAAVGNQSNERLSDNLLLSVNQKLNINNPSLLASKVALTGISNQRFAGLQQSLIQQSNNESSVQSVSDQAENVQIDAYNWHIWDGPASDDPSKLNNGNPVEFGAVFRWHLKGSFDLTENQLKSKSLIKVTTFGEEQTPVQSYRLRVDFPTNLILKDGTFVGTFLVKSDGLYVQLNGSYKGTGSQNFSFDRVYCETGYLPTIRPFRGKGPIGTTLTWTFGNNRYSAKVAAPKVCDVLTSKNGSFTGSNTPNVYGAFGLGNEMIDWSIASNLTDAQRSAWLNSAGQTIGTGSLDENSSVSYAFSLKADDTLIPSNVHIEKYGETMGSDGKLYSNADEGFLNQYTFKGQLIDDYNAVQTSDNLSLAQLEVYSKQDTNKYDAVWWSRQEDGTLLFYAHFTPDQLKITRYDVLRDDANNRSTTNFDKDPEKAVQNTVNYYSKNGVLKGYPRWERFVFWIGRSDPTRRTTTTITYYDPSTFTVLNSVKNSGWGPSSSVGVVKGQSTVKLHVISSTNGTDLATVKSFTDWPDQNKHAQLDIPTIAGYQLAADPQNVLSKFHFNGEVITANSSVDYPAENTIADYYIVLAPKDENMTVNIVDDDENGKVLDSGTISGKFGDKVVETSNIQGKVKKLLNSGLYTLESNDLDNGLTFKDGSQTATVKLKHKLDSVQRHYRVIEDLPDGTKKVIIDMEATLYKDAAQNYYEDYGAWTKDGKWLKHNEVKLLKQTNIFDNPGSDYVNATVDSVTGYRHYIDRSVYPHYGDYYGGLGVWGDNSTVWMDLFKPADPHDGVGVATNIFPSTDFHIVYAPKDEAATVNIIDVDENNKVLSTGTVTGKFNTQIVTNDDVQAKLKSLLDTGHYVLQSNGFDQVAKYQDGTNTITIALKHKIDSTQRHYRVIEDLPDGTKKVIIDVEATLYKDANAKYYNEWGANLNGIGKVLKSNEYRILAGQQASSFSNNSDVVSAVDMIPGYTATFVDPLLRYQDGVYAVLMDDGKARVDVFNGSGAYNDPASGLCAVNPLSSRDFHITYSRRSYPVTVNYYDVDGKLVNSVTSMHKFGDTVSIAPVTPTNYVLVSGQAKTDYLMRLGLNEVDFLVEPKLTTITETKTVSRTIKVQTPDGQTNNVVQTVTFVRNSYLNQVTKQTTYSPWSFGGQYQFSGYLSKPRAGYTADVVPAVIVTPDSLNTTVNVDYHKVPVVYEIDYKLANGTVVKNVSATPERDGVIHLTAPQGYRLLTTVTDVKVGHSSQKLTILVLPNEQTYTAYSALPSSVTEPLTKTITRTINITMPNGRVRRIVQQVHFVRTATVAANGKITYSNWTGVGQTSFGRLFVPKRRGYRLVMTDNQDQTLIGVNQLVVDPMMNNVVINVKYVK